jgi:hypothetical protein
MLYEVVLPGICGKAFEGGNLCNWFFLSRSAPREKQESECKYPLPIIKISSKKQLLLFTKVGKELAVLK